MNDLFGKELAQKRELTERKQLFLSKYCLLFLLSPERPNFFCTIYSKRLSPREMRMYTLTS